MESDEFMTTQELADYLRVPRATVYRWRHVGYGPQGYSIGRGVRYRRSEVDEWVQQQKGKPA